MNIYIWMYSKFASVLRKTEVILGRSQKPEQRGLEKRTEPHPWEGPVKLAVHSPQRRHRQVLGCSFSEPRPAVWKPETQSRENTSSPVLQAHQEPKRMIVCEISEIKTSYNIFFVVVFLGKKIKKQPQHGVALMSPECSKHMPRELARSMIISLPMKTSA